MEFIVRKEEMVSCWRLQIATDSCPIGVSANSCPAGAP